RSEENEESVVHYDESVDLASDDENISVDYSKLSKEDLVAALKRLIEQKPVHKIKNEIEVIKTNFYKKHHAEIEDNKKKYMEAGGLPEEYDSGTDTSEENLKAYIQKYKDIKTDYQKELEKEKVENLNLKLQVIEDLKNLGKKEESVNKTFQEFRDLQKRWTEIGLVPQNSIKELWENYNFWIDNFYKIIRINKDLRDNDLKKNLEHKIELCEKAEELLLEPDILVAFEKLQNLHDFWREAGPVSEDKKDEIWDRFKETTNKINKKHQDYYIQKKEERENNLKAKIEICEKIEQFNEQNYESHGVWENKTNEILELQKVWKAIGEIPRKDSNLVFTRFRATCDVFFERKKVFYESLKEDQNDNLQKKIDVCVQAESLMESSDWKRTTDEFFKLQEKWKTIGPAPKKKSDEVWRRFRKACDHFFNRKAESFKSKIQEEEENLKLKIELIEKLNNFSPIGNANQDLAQLKEFQREWTNIGNIPLKQKDIMQQQFKDAINRQFGKLELDDSKIELYQFKMKIESIIQETQPKEKLEAEREKISRTLSKMESDVILIENNMGFFKNSSNASGIINEMKNKIENGKKQVTVLKSKADIVNKALDSIRKVIR
ncbi:MAG: DUF349 domain-containing protein, partial [Bacteroidota bacterium]